jgi:ATP-dependent protease ClpP protease subunit
MTPEEAKTYGLIDEIIKTKKWRVGSFFNTIKN